jgi:hypothetical protein
MTIWLAAVALGIAGATFAGMAFGGWKPRQMRRAAGSAPGFPLALPRFAPRLPYERKQLLTAWERRALLSMRAQLPPGFYVCPQVRLADMLRIRGADRMGRMAALGKVASVGRRLTARLRPTHNQCLSVRLCISCRRLT